MGALFLLLTAIMAGIAWAAYKADQWVILVAAGVHRGLDGDARDPRLSPELAGVRRGAAYSLRVADDTRALWRSYRKSGDAGMRDRLILTYAPLVKFVAGRISSGLPSHVDENDLVSYGLLGLIGAIERYDPDRDVKFETYAIARIKGSIIDELRAMDWVPRSVRSRAREIERAIAKLEAELHRSPTDEEIAEKLGIELEELDQSLLDISRSSIAALDELWTVSSSTGDKVALIDTIEDREGPQPDSALDVTETKEAMAEAIAACPSARRSSSRSTTTRS